MKTLSYSGIGSRKSPIDVGFRMVGISMHLANLGYNLRSGGADGSDTEFARGCSSVNGKKEIYLPWKGFNDDPSDLYLENLDPLKVYEARMIAKTHTPHWNNLSESVKNLKSRNIFQLFGPTLDDPVEFVVCWTPNGKDVGGTGINLRIALEHNIPIYNLYHPDVENFIKFLD